MSRRRFIVYTDECPNCAARSGDRATVISDNQEAHVRQATLKSIRGYIEKKTEEAGAPGVIRTPDLLVRSQTLYPTELRAQYS